MTWRGPSSPGASAGSGQPPALDWLSALKSADGLFVCDGRERVVAWSPSAQHLLGYRADEVVGRPCYRVIAGTEPRGHPICGRGCRVASNARQGRPTPSFEVVARTREGRRLWLNSSIVLIQGAERRTPLIVHLIRPAKDARPPDGVRLKRVEPTATAAVVQSLTRRELTVVRHLAAGRTTEEIATELGLSRYTARNHINSLERKLGASTRLEAVLLASRHNLI